MNGQGRRRRACRVQRVDVQCATVRQPEQTMRPIQWLIPLAAALLAAGCAGPVREAGPAPVESRVEPGQTGGGTAEVHPYRPPEQVALARPQPARAVQVLLRRAADQQRAGDHAAAAASLERAVRIEPRNAQLWNRLAHVYLQQQQFGRVEQFAAKSNALASDDRVLQADNWQLIAAARAARGDRRGAAEARRHASVQR